MIVAGKKYSVICSDYFKEKALPLKAKSHWANRVDFFSYIYNSFLCAVGFELLQVGELPAVPLSNS